MSKFDESIVRQLSATGSAKALVRVKSPIHLNAIERNFQVDSRYPFIKSLAISFDSSDAIRLERINEVECVTSQLKVKALENEYILNSDDNVIIEANSSLPPALRGLTGKGVNLCVMDTGISPHIDLSIPKHRILHFEDFVNGESLPYDDNGHGTFVSGIAAGNGVLSANKIVGVAPQANLIGLKVISETGETGTFKVLDGMQWLFDNARKYNIKVVCMSFGAEPAGYVDPLKLGVEMLVMSGLTVVCASGNSGKDCLMSPGISQDTITVGSVDSDLNIADFTSYGHYKNIFRPDVFTNGVKIRGLSAGGTYSIMSGTSVSAPYIAGLCCLLHQKYKNLSPLQTKHAIYQMSMKKNGINILNFDN